MKRMWTQGLNELKRNLQVKVTSVLLVKCMAVLWTECLWPFQIQMLKLYHIVWQY
jgi:hypothetical protein